MAHSSAEQDRFVVPAALSCTCWLALRVHQLQVIDFFMRQKADLDNKNNPSMEDLTSTCHALTTVRALLLGGLNRCVCACWAFAMGSSSAQCMLCVTSTTACL